MITVFQLFLQISPQETWGPGKIISSKQGLYPVGKQKEQNREMQEGCCCRLDCLFSLLYNILKCSINVLEELLVRGKITVKF